MYNIYIDDTSISGNPCEVYSVKTNYKSYIAIILEENDSVAVRKIMLGLAEFLKKQYGTDEFHFTDIYSGHGSYKTMKADEKIDIFSVFSELITHFNIQWTVQSMSNESKEKLKNDFPKLQIDKDPTPPDEAELALLLKQLNKLIKSRIIPSNNIHIVCDNGIKKPGESLIFSDTKKIYVFSPTIHFEDSKKEPLLQLADFVAFCFLRNQIGIQKFFENQTSGPESFYSQLQSITSSVMSTCVSPYVYQKVIKETDTFDSINSEAKNWLKKKKE